MTQAGTSDTTGRNKRERDATRLGDRALGIAGIALASAAAFFPWYVFLNEDKFGIRVQQLDHSRDLPPGRPRNVMSVSPLAMIDNSDDEQLALQQTDMLTTATISDLGDEKDGGGGLQPQPFPGKGDFRLLHVANGRALIEDGSGMYMVRVGSILPDNSKLATIEQRGGNWVIVTSSGQSYGEGETARP